MKHHPALRYLFVILVVLAFGAVDALIKGQHGGTRDAVANISAPWLLISFLSAAVLAPRRLTSGATVGILSTIVALVAYTGVRALRGFHTSGHANDLMATVSSSLANRWFLLGIFGGAALGMAGSRLALRRHAMAVGLVVGSALMMEPIARVLWALAKEEPARTLVPSPAVWTIEVVVGCAAVLAVLLRHRQQDQKGAPSRPS